MRPAVCFRPCVLLAVWVLASCGATSTTAPTTTEAATTTTAAPSRLTLTDVERAIGTPDDMQARSSALAGDYEFATTREVPVAEAAGLFVEANGIVQAFSRRITMNYVNESDPMALHRARGIVRVIVFDTTSNASVAVRKQGNSFDPVGTREADKTSFMSNVDGVRRTGRWHVRVGGDLPCLHEGLSQHGRVVAWMVVRNKNCRGWVENLPAEIANFVASSLVENNPRFAG